MDEDSANALLGLLGLLLAAGVIVGFVLEWLTADSAVLVVALAVVSLALGVVPFEKLP